MLSPQNDGGSGIRRRREARSRNVWLEHLPKQSHTSRRCDRMNMGTDDKGTRLIIESCTMPERLVCDLIDGTAVLGDDAEIFGIPSFDVDEITEALESFRDDDIYDLTHLNRSGDWFLRAEGGIRTSKTGTDLPADLSIITNTLLESALDSGCRRSADLLEDIIALFERNPSDEYLGYHAGLMRGFLDRETAVRFMTEAKTDRMKERGRSVALRISMDLLRQNGFGDIVAIWKG